MSKWTQIRLGDHAETFAGGTPDRDDPRFFGGTIPWVKSTEVNLGRIRKTEEFLTEDGLRFSSAKRIPANTVLVAMYGATAAQIAYLEIEATANQAVLAVVPNENIDSVFLFYALTAARERILFQAQGSGQPNLNKRIIDRVGIDLPPLSEQRRIAEILATVDEAIEQTEALVQKWRQMKAGLMHDLFTRGVTPDGQLRPTRQTAPQLYKQSPLGWIPKEWEVMPLDEHVRIIDCKHYTPKFQPEGFPFIRPRNVKVDGLDLNGVDYVSAEDFRLLTDVYRPRRGDIVFSRNASFGVPCYIDTDIQFAIGQDCVIMIPKVSGTRFIFCALTNNITAAQIAKVSGGSTFARINLGEIRKLLIPHPGKDEEERIAERLFDCEAYKKKLMDELVQIHSQKQGLMQDLLTGRVLVRVAT